MSILGWLIVAVACALVTHRVRAHEGLSVDLAFGITGAVLAGCLFSHVFADAPMAQVSLGSLAAAALGAEGLLLAQRLASRRHPQ